jgi:TP901 family phage tail tape measure protein
MATSKTLELSIKIAGRMDKSLTAAINGTQSKIGSLTKSISNIGTVGLATMGAVATAAAVGIAGCTKEAQALESAMAPVVRYVDGLADASGAVSDAIADNGKTFKQNYGALKTYIQDLSTDIPRTTDQLTAMSAALGQSGIGVDQQLTTGYLRDTAVTATAMDLDDQTAGNYVAKWEASFNFDHKQVMELMDQINYLGAHNATTAAEIAQSVNSAASMGQIAGVNPAATAAMATAMQATGVSTDRVGTSISRIYTNLSKGSNATKAQKEMWEELGFTAEGIAKSMRTDGVGTLREVFTALQDMPDERKVAALSTLFGQWAIEGGAKITNNLGAYEKALAMVSAPSLYTGSMEREFIIQASTSESIDTMVKNSVTALKQDIGTEFLPVKKTLSLAVIDMMNGVRKDMPQLQTLAGTLADLLSAGISKLGDALQAALPYVQKTLDYVANNGPQVAGILGGLAGTFAAMKFAPLAGNILEGAGSLLFGESGGLGAAAGGSKRSGGLLGAVGSLFTGGQKFAGNAVGTISNVAEAAGVGATMANSNMTRTQWGAVTSNGSGSFMQRLENSAIGAYFGIKNRGTLTNQKGTDYKFMQGLMGVAGQITDAKQGGGLLGMAKNAVTGSPIGQYFGGIRAAAGNVANTTIGSKIAGFGKGTIGVSKEILAGIAGPEGLGLTNLVSGAKGLAQNGAGWVAGKAGNVISTVANSGVGQAVGGAAGKVGGVAKGVVSVGSNALGALGNFAGAGAGLLGSVWGPVAGGFGSLFAGAAPVIAAISGIIAVVSILGDHLEDIRGIVVNVFGETGGQVFDVFTGKLQGVADFVTGLFSEGGVAAALAPLQNTITNLFGENAGAAFGGVVTILQSIMGVVGQIVTFATGTVKPIIQDVFAFITGTVLPIILQTFTAAAPTIASIITNLGSAVMSAIQGFFQGLITFITGVFSGSWSQAWEGIKQIFGSAFDGLVALCKAPLNAVIAIINKAISGINGLGLTIPEWVPILGGKSFSVNIPTLPMLARGGFTDGASIAGEAGTEAVISFQRGVRSDNINTWTQAGRMLGVSGEQAAVAAGVPYADGGGAVELATLDATQDNNAVELQEIDTGKPQPEQDGGGTPDGGGQVVFAPQITVQGNADRAVLESVLDDAQQRFELWYEQMMRRKARTAY